MKYSTIQNRTPQVSPRSEVEPGGNFPALPPGQYLAEIVRREWCSTHLDLDLKVLDGPYAGRLFWDRFHIDNPDSVWNTIDRLLDVCAAAGVSTLIELHDHPLLVTVSPSIVGGYASVPQESPDMQPLRERHSLAAMGGDGTVTPAVEAHQDDPFRVY